MNRSDFEPTPADINLKIRDVITELEAANRTPDFPKTAVAHLQTAIRQLHALESSCPCGTLKLYRVTLGQSGRNVFFTGLIE